MNDQSQSDTYTFIMVTGASKGLGRSFAVAFARHLLKMEPNTKIRFALIARCLDGLVETKSLIGQVGTSLNKKGLLEISCHAFDLGELKTLDLSLNEVLNSRCPLCRRAILFNNAGSTGELMPVADLTSLALLKVAIDFNVTSSLWLTSRFVKHFRSCRGNTNRTQVIVINTSSGMALRPFKTCSIYCAAKAARKIFHEALALECLENYKDVQVVNYHPGVCDTDMQRFARESKTIDRSINESFQQMKEGNKLVTPEASANELVKIVFEKEILSGAHYEYYEDVSSGDQRRCRDMEYDKGF